MSTASRDFDTENRTVEVITNRDANTVTFVADRDADEEVPPTEWITAEAGDLVDVESHR
jgi:hypothetical protein